MTFAGYARCLEDLLVDTARGKGEVDKGKLQQWRAYFRGEIRPVLREYLDSNCSPTYLYATKLLKIATDVERRMQTIYTALPTKKEEEPYAAIKEFLGTKE